MSASVISSDIDEESGSILSNEILVANRRLVRASNSESFKTIEDDTITLSEDTDDEPTTQKLKRSHKHRKKETLETYDKIVSIWIVYCYLVTFWAIPYFMRLCGLKTKDQQKLWREKIGLIVIIFILGTFVAYLTLGLMKTTCSFQDTKINISDLDSSYVSIHGRAFKFRPLYEEDVTELGFDSEMGYITGPAYSGGMDYSFQFQNIDENCANLIVLSTDELISDESDITPLYTYFPCYPYDSNGMRENTGNCHLENSDKFDLFHMFTNSSDIIFTWDQLRDDPNRQLVAYNGNVMDLNLLQYFKNENFEYPFEFDELANSGTLSGYDISLLFTTKHDKEIARCLVDLTKVGEIDSETIGCLFSSTILYVSLILILSIVIFKFIAACYFRWIISKKQGAYQLDNKSFIEYINGIEEWSKNMNVEAPIKKVDPHLRPKQPKDKIYSTFKRKSSISSNLLKRSSQIYSSSSNSSFPSLPKIDENNPVKNLHGLTTMPIQSALHHTKSASISKCFSSPLDPSTFLNSTPMPHSAKSFSKSIIHENVVEQPPITYMPDKYPLIHTVCFVTCYSEDEKGIRVTLDSLSTSDYPNSHKLLFIVCDGLIKGSGSDEYTSDIILKMMNDYVKPPQQVEPSSYISISTGSKQHNMAKVYAGFYKYNDFTVPRDKQQRVPMILVVKCGTPAEQVSAKPGNRGKRDSQVILMSFMKKLVLNERMTTLEYMLLKNIYQLTGLMADKYEAVLMVDADTKVFPDSLTHMIAELVKDPLIMGLCGETKIANKTDSWVTAIQVFEYYISHHQIKAFESVFNSVTCLPGCFSIYRIKSPKGEDGEWVPILANPEIVEKYSDNDTRSLHKKNLLLLGEDRYLSSLMLKTFPKRKQIFVNKAACKTIVPSEFFVLLSQRRRWINSTIHNLFELVLVKNLCGTFFFSMQFVVVIELIGTLVLPLAICLTVYVILFSIFSSPTPILALILLAVILGLPGVLVVVTSTKWSYIIWMLIYLLALPIWNLILPSYAYWKFDDFSWGKTRAIADNKTVSQVQTTNSDTCPGIELKRWEEFEDDLVEIS
ncbi:chitin synthase 3 [Monosporozyma unispora]